MTVLGVTPELLGIRQEKVTTGAFLSPLEEAKSLNVAVLGHTAAKHIFGGLDPVGQEIFIGQAPFRVIGVLAYQGGAKIGSGQVAALTAGSSGSSGTDSGSANTGTTATGSGSSASSGTSACGSGSSGGSGASSGSSGGSCAQQTVAVGSGIDSAILIPESTAVWLTDDTEVSAIWMKARSRTDVQPVVLEAQRILQDEVIAPVSGSAPTARSIPSVPGQGGFCAGPACANQGGSQLVLASGGGKAVTVSSLNTLVQQADAANRVLTLMLAAIAGVSLLVGGIGVMNIMLVSVRERTVEIGLRKALGAFQVDLLYQFVMEALVVSVLGGVCGWMLGFGGVKVFQHYHVDAVSLPGSLLVALAAAAGVGVLFGTYPAYVASELQPVEALRRQ
jgi:hypothetical protein